VHWSQNAVTAIATPGARTEITVSLTAAQALGNVALRIVPEIDPYVDVTPTVLANVRAGDTYTIRISVAPAANAPLGLFDGTIQVREQVARRGLGRVYPRPLPVSVLIRGQDDEVAGTDADGNEVWDYVDQYIDSTLPGDANTAVRSASRQYARALQGGLLNAADQTLSLDYATRTDRATECVFHLRPQDAYDLLTDLEAAILNTVLRSRAFLMFSDQSAGQVFRSAPFAERGASCVAEQ
jgi:hypothetical protein